jgi:hypothetical protein
MARLIDQEKAQLKEATARKAPRAPAPPALPAERFLRFAAFASSVGKQSTKPVRFGGSHWKL